MNFQSDVVVHGAKASQGDFNGKPFNSCKVYIATEMQAGERSTGIATTEYTWGLSTNFESIENLSYPFKAKATMQVVTNGRDTRTILIDLVPEKASQILKPTGI